MEGRGSEPYFDPDYDSLVERINPRVCIDNETCEDCTLVKVDSANRHGILLEMVQLLTDLDLVISKSYISSDGGWLMDVFHVADQLGNKLTDPTTLRYIQQSLVSGWKGTRSTVEVRTCLGKLLGPGQLASGYPAIEITATDRPGLLSEIAAVLAELHCHVACAQAWTHNSRAAVILYVTDEPARTPIADADWLAHIEQQVDSVVEAHHGPGERRRVKVSGPTPGRVHTERRLHQLMYEDGDYEAGPPPPPVNGDHFADANLEARRGNVLFLSSPSSSSSSSSASSAVIKTRASIDSWKKRGYSVVNIQSRDRPKLLFDTVCTLTDMQYVVFHAAVGSHGPLAVQEYYIRHMDGCTLDSERDRQKVSRCLVAAVERRVSHGLRLDVSARDRPGLLSDVTRVLRENSLSLTRAECAARGERAVGTFYVTDASGGGDVDPKRVNAVRQEMGDSVTVEASNDATREWSSAKSSNNGSSSSRLTSSSAGGSRSRSMTSLGSSLGSLLWAHIERLSSNFGSIRS
ncbi:unnamed protein product [Musa hybrid cultivar]